MAAHCCGSAAPSPPTSLPRKSQVAIINPNLYQFHPFLHSTTSLVYPSPQHINKFFEFALISLIHPFFLAICILCDRPRDHTLTDFWGADGDWSNSSRSTRVHHNVTSHPALTGSQRISDETRWQPPDPPHPPLRSLQRLQLHVSAHGVILGNPISHANPTESLLSAPRTRRRLPQPRSASLVATSLPPACRPRRSDSPPPTAFAAHPAS